MSPQVELETTFATRLGADQLAELARLHREGATLAQLAAKYRMPESNIRLALRRAAKKGLDTQAA
ncbi:MAG: hypothetical protein Q4F72_11330 [Desulfovibrionaceae bacterium]|nr:hypothetical protein [Desulfovibrionaceae bacterium]